MLSPTILIIYQIFINILYRIIAASPRVMVALPLNLPSVRSRSVQSFGNALTIRAAISVWAVYLSGASGKYSVFKTWLPELHRQLTFYSASKGKTLSSAVEETIRDYVSSVRYGHKLIYPVARYNRYPDSLLAPVS